MSALLALIASSIWGVTDFVGGTLSRRIHPLAVAGIGQVLVLPVVAAVVFLLGAQHNPSGWLLWGVIAGVLQPISLALFFEALATGKMGVVAPIGSTGVAVPVAIGLAQGERPAELQLAGIALCVIGVVMASGPEFRSVREHDAPGDARALGLALAAAAGFGGVLYSVARGGHFSAGMTVLTSRVVMLVPLGIAWLVTRSTGGVRPNDLPVLVAMSGGDVLGGGLYSVASGRSLVAVVAVLASLYPVITALLARFIHHERLKVAQILGALGALGGVALITIG
ncbi:MAG TPA: EamA family transporter [Acidimicrobiales bacterium]|nr:EamA family transporter [Acidimicrobiales bacterium]